MFYCDPCAEKAEYPKTFFKSRGRCEMCEVTSICNDMPSRLLPMPDDQRALLDKLMEGRCRICGELLEGGHECVA